MTLLVVALAGVARAGEWPVTIYSNAAGTEYIIKAYWRSDQ